MNVMFAGVFSCARDWLPHKKGPSGNLVGDSRWTHLVEINDSAIRAASPFICSMAHQFAVPKNGIRSRFVFDPKPSRPIDDASGPEHVWRAAQIRGHLSRRVDSQRRTSSIAFRSHHPLRTTGPRFRLGQLIAIAAGSSTSLNPD